MVVYECNIYIWLYILEYNSVYKGGKALYIMESKEKMWKKSFNSCSQPLNSYSKTERFPDRRSLGEKGKANELHDTAFVFKQPKSSDVRVGISGFYAHCKMKGEK